MLLFSLKLWSTRALIAGPLIAVGGFQRNVAVFRPSPAAAKLFGDGYDVSRPPTTLSIDLPAVLLSGSLMLYVRMQRSDVDVAQRGTSSAPVLGFTSSVELRVIVVPPMTRIGRVRHEVTEDAVACFVRVD